MSAPASAVTADEGVASLEPVKAIAIRPGGVGAGLATDQWWDQYYRQMHDTHWDWYLPNDTVIQFIMREARLLCGIDTPDTALRIEIERSPAESPTHSETASSALASLPILQLGCGNSEITRMLWNVGLRTMQNVDFSAECIERMTALQLKEGWTTTHTATSGNTSADSFGASFAFRLMDVRSIEYSDSSFQLAFGKGCIDCVVLESTDSIASGRAMLREVHRVLQPGGISMEFSLYPPQARARYWLEVFTTKEGSAERAEEEAEVEDLLEVMQADNPPQRVETRAWSEIRLLPLDCSPLELPNQRYTYIYIATKRLR